MSGQNEIVMKQGDTLPPITGTMYQANGLPVDLTDAVVTFWMRVAGVKDGVKVDGGAVNVVNETKGIIQYNWGSGDTDTLGSYEAEFRVEYPGGQRFTVPDDGYYIVTVKDDIEYNSNDSGWPV